MKARLFVVAGLLIAPLAPIAGGLADPYEWIELKAAAPEWWTPDVRAAADLAGAQGLWYSPLTGEFVDPDREASAAPANVPYGAPDYLFIRPGALALSESGFLCTYNFIYSGGTQIGTAGHCMEAVGEDMYILATPAPTVPLITSLGTVASRRNGGVGDDWSLTTINAQWRTWVDPNMAYIGGPSCSVWNPIGGPVKISGHGIQTGAAASVPRVSTSTASNGNSFAGVGLVSSGDSGSAVIQVQATTPTPCSGGAAAGVLTHCLGIVVVCLPSYSATDIRRVPATVTVGFDPL